MKLAFIVGIGSFMGGIGRYLLSSFIQEKTTNIFPYGTLSVNLMGCFFIGCLFGLAEKWQLNLELRLLFITGLLGGFTTFSAFSVEFIHLFKTGNTGLGITYVLSSVILGIGLTFLGAWLFRYIPGRV
jgi:CrcB protein